MQTGSGKTAAFLLPIIHRMIETDADAGAGPQCIVVTPTRFDFLQCLEMHHIAHFLGFTPFNGLILEPMCENNSLYLDDGEPFLSSSIQTLKQASVRNFCLLSESWWSTRQVMFVVRELAIQIHNEARKFAQGSMIKSVVAYGGTSVFYQASQLQRGCNILVATPGRLYLSYTLFIATFEVVRDLIS